MSIDAIQTITKREVREMVYDWRIMVPIFLLSFILPLMLVGASSRVIRFVEDDALAQRLVPFAVLLVGFIPSSFSLITALESFVGERERNSLESLLSMPISDKDLYVGKLISSLITPLLSSYMAMIIFTFLMYTIDPILYFGAITTTRLFMLFIIIGLIATAMVSGAVVISSHISSIRAANLMSSFILVPMALVIQIFSFLIINDHWDVVFMAAGAMFILATLFIRLGLITFNREEILSREHQDTSDWNFLRFLSISPKDRHQPIKARKTSPIIAIARRELREALTDWRVLLPSFVLTCIIPIALISGTDFAVNFVEQPFLIARLVPFAILLVGFIPASFSLIVALDSFVGERERNSLEALFSMPISDNQLYTSKLATSCVAPVLTSWAAMVVFAAGMSIVHPQLYYFSMTPMILIQLLLMITVMTIVMVAGAVVISTHTSTIRAANLLASFLLLPMAIAIQLQALLIIASRWEAMWYVIYALIIVAIALIRTGMALFNREEILSREHEQFNLQQLKQTFLTFLREHQPAGVLPDEYRGDTFSVRRFYTKEFPALVRELRQPIVAALVAAVMGLIIGWYIADDFSFIGNLKDGAKKFVASVGQPPLPSSSPLLVLYIFFNNIRVSVLSNIFSVFALGTFAFLVPIVAFTQISFLSFSLQSKGGDWFTLGVDSPLQFLLAYVVPHGIIELPTFLFSAAIGIRIGASVLRPPGGFSVGQNILWSLANFAKIWLLVLLPLTFLGAMVEGILTPMVIQALY